MGRQQVPIPAASLREICHGASEQIEHLREQNHIHTVERVERLIEESLELAEGKDGEFVSVDGTSLSTLTAKSVLHTGESSVGTHYLYQYGVWEDSE